MHNISRVLAILSLLCSNVQPQAMPSPTPNSGCPEGEFSPGVGMACDKGPPGSFAESIGSFLCSVCAEGYYQPSSGQSKCIAAPNGSHVPGVGQISFQPCPVGTFNDKEGQSSSAACRPCPAGSFSSQKGATICSPCAAGSFSSQKGATVCSPCAAGSFSSQAGATGCSQCPAGKFSSAGSTECTTSCSEFQYVNAESRACMDCPHQGLAKSDRLSCYRKAAFSPCNLSRGCGIPMDSDRAGTAWTINGGDFWFGWLSSATNISKVVLWRRTDGSRDEFVGIWVWVGWIDRRPRQLCGPVSSADKPYFIVDCSHRGVKYVEVYNNNHHRRDKLFSVTEVEVYAD